MCIRDRSVVARFGRTLHVDRLRQGPAIHEDLAPGALLLVGDQDAVWRGAEGHSAPVGDRVGEYLAREAKRIAGDVRFVRFTRRAVGPAPEIRGEAVGLALLEDRFARGCQRRHGIGLVAGARSYPRAGQVSFRRGAGRIRHLRDALGYESVAVDALTLLSSGGRGVHD